MSEVVSVRFTADEITELKQAAEARGRKLSTHVHELAMIGLLHTRPGVETRRLPSGGVLTTWPADPNPMIGVI